jgi:hypothetical protein
MVPPMAWFALTLWAVFPHWFTMSLASLCSIGLFLSLGSLSNTWSIVFPWVIVFRLVHCVAFGGWFHCAQVEKLKALVAEFQGRREQAGGASGSGENVGVRAPASLAPPRVLPPRVPS